jgi:hypothetical protein
MQKVYNNYVMLSERDSAASVNYVSREEGLIGRHLAGHVKITSGLP